MKATHLVLLGFASLLLETQVRSADIVALCIGNDAYVKAEDRLDTPVADATLMRDTLRAIPGVRAKDVELLPDGTREQIRAALRQFREKARGARLSIVFYSGHGIEDQPTGYDRAETFLLPVDAVIEGAEQLPDRAVGLGEVLGVFTGLPPGGRVVILDCCRTGAPSATKALAGSGKNVSEDLDARVARALGQAELAEGTLVSFSAGPGRKAAAFLKETDAYSPFTHFLAQGIREEGGDLFAILSRATATTREATGGRQVPRVKFEGDPSLITSVRFGASAEPEKAVDAVTSAEMAKLREELATALAKLAAADGNAAEMAKLQKELEEARTKVAEAVKPVPSIPVASTPDPRPSTPSTMVRSDPAPPAAFPASRGMEGTRAGEVRTFGGIEVVWCPPGEFLMGSPEHEADRDEDETQHRVTLTKGFWLAKTECTQAQWESVMGSNPSNFKGADLPVEQVSWNDVQQWLAEMNERHPLPTGWKWDLPTEAQWEYACRAGTGKAFAGDMDEMAWYSSNGGFKTNPVGTKKANAWGLHDMHGNVWEWCVDYYDAYASESATDPRGPTMGGRRVFRGGSWSFLPLSCRSANRDRYSQGLRFTNLGFRPAPVPSKP